MKIIQLIPEFIIKVVRIGHTFNINEKGYYGLLENKMAYLITVKGGAYRGTPMEKYDFQEPYLKTILGHMGITTQKLFSLENSSDSNTVKQNKLELQNDINQFFKN